MIGPGGRRARPEYSWQRLYRLATDGIASASIRPLRLAQVFAWCYLVLSLLLVGFVAGHRELLDKPGFMLFVLLVVNVSGLGLIMFCFYILGAYLGRMYLEVKSRPTYLIMEKFQSPALSREETGPQ